MGRATELIALSNMTSDERKRFAYGNNAATYFTHITIDTKCDSYWETFNTK
jgi:hypothetical protein